LAIERGFSAEATRVRRKECRSTLWWHRQALLPLIHGDSVTMNLIMMPARVRANRSVTEFFLILTHSVEEGERDRHGRCQRRPAAGFLRGHLEPNRASLPRAVWSAGRRPVRARRTRSPNQQNRSGLGILEL